MAENNRAKILWDQTDKLVLANQPTRHSDGTIKQQEWWMWQSQLTATPRRRNMKRLKSTKSWKNNCNRCGRWKSKVISEVTGALGNKMKNEKFAKWKSSSSRFQVQQVRYLDELRCCTAQKPQTSRPHILHMIMSRYWAWLQSYSSILKKKKKT